VFNKKKKRKKNDLGKNSEELSNQIEKRRKGEKGSVCLEEKKM